MKVPCKNCPDRHNLCWDECERFRAYRKEKDRIAAAKRKENELTNAHQDRQRRLRKLRS